MAWASGGGDGSATACRARCRSRFSGVPDVANRGSQSLHFSKFAKLPLGVPETLLPADRCRTCLLAVGFAESESGFE